MPNEDTVCMFCQFSDFTQENPGLKHLNKDYNQECFVAELVKKENDSSGKKLITLKTYDATKETFLMYKCLWIDCEEGDCLLAQVSCYFGNRNIRQCDLLA